MNYHIIRTGDSLEKIAYGYNLDVEEITRINKHISNFQKLIPGTKIKLPEISNELAIELDEVEPFIEDYYPKIDLPVEEEKLDIKEVKEEIKPVEKIEIENSTIKEEKPAVKKATINKPYNPYYYYPYPYGYNNYYMNYYQSYKNPKKRSR